MKSLSSLKKLYSPQKKYISKLIHFGGWLTVTNIISPIMVNLDRFVIGSLLTMAAVAYYVTPFDMLSRLNIITGSITPVLFSAFSSAAARERSSMNKLFSYSFSYLFIAMMAIGGILIAMAKPFLNIWLGPEFSANSSAILQILAVGFLINSLAHIPFSAIQATGRPDITAKLHLAELPVYLVAIVALIKWWGLPGIALAWTLRVSLDTILLFWFAEHLQILPERIMRNNLGNILYWSVSLVIYLILMMYVNNIFIQSACLLIYLLMLLIFGWRQALGEEDKNLFKARLNSLSKRAVKHEFF